MQFTQTHRILTLSFTSFFLIFTVNCNFMNHLLGLKTESEDTTRLQIGALTLANPSGKSTLYLMMSGTLQDDGGTALPNYFVSINPAAVTTDFDYPTVASQNITCPAAILNQIPGAICAETDTNGFFLITFSTSVGKSVTQGSLGLKLGVFNNSGVKQGDLDFTIGYGGGDSCSASMTTITPAAGATVTLGTLTISPICTVPGASEIGIAVINAGLNNTFKSIPAPAVELWAVTTLYETPGYEGEKVKLVSNDGGANFTGRLPVNDGNPRTVIVFDDVFVKPHPYAGTYVGASTSSGTGQHKLVITDNFFSPCLGYNNGNPLANQVLMNTIMVATQTSPTTISVPIYPPRLPNFGPPFTPSAAAANDEVFSMMPNQKMGDLILVDYTTLTKANASLFCECSKGIKLNGYSSSTNFSGPYFTDNNFDAAGGICGPRAP